MADHGDSRPSIALLGAGMFVKDAYVRILGNLTDQVRLRYVWSRTQAAAEVVVDLCRPFAPDVQARSGDAGLAEILEGDKVRAVAVALAAQVQPAIVAKALQAGKHVLQEKPAGINLEHALATLKLHQELSAKQSRNAPIWAIAENYRFEPGLLEAAEVVKTLGEMMLVEMNIENPMAKTNKYYSSEWRRDPAFHGAFITDGAVHFIAALRLITGCEVVAASAWASHVDKGLPPPDNVSGLLRLSNGCGCAMAISYGATSRNIKWRVVCALGTVEVERTVQDSKHGYSVVTVYADGRRQQSFHPFAGVEEEIASFASDVRQTVAEGAVKQNPRSSAVEGLRDLAAVEAALQSSLQDSRVVQVVQV